MPLMMAACSGRNSSTGASADSDSLASEELQKQIVQHLPDTSFASAEAVKYNVENPDSAISGKIDNLGNLYADTPGAFTFRKDEMRNASFGGTVKGCPKDIAVDWEFTTAIDDRDTKFGRWGGGTGWTGQPLYVEWPDSCIRRFKQAGTVNANFGKEEIIVGSLSSNIYFINYRTGKATREPIPTVNPIKGTISLDPTLNGNLYFGQGVPAERPFGARVVDLYKHEVTHEVNEDPKALRHWGAYDSSPVRVGQFLFRPGENGTLYKYTVGTGTLKLHSAMRYTVNGAAPGIESSMSVYKNYGYFGDNAGNVICVNLNTLKPVWRYDLKDDIDGTPVVAEENGIPYIYVGCEIDKQKEGFAYFAKINGLDGKLIWESKLPGKRFDIDNKHFDGGYYATALVGTGNCSDLVFCNVVSNLDGQKGDFVALSRKDGSVAYSTRLRYYAWSSPVGFLNEKDELFIFTCDCAGNAYIIDGRKGDIITYKHIGNNFESSPVVHGSSLVVGSRGDKIFKLTLK